MNNENQFNNLEIQKAEKDDTTSFNMQKIKRNKTIVILVIANLLLCLSFGGYIYNQTQSDTKHNRDASGNNTDSDDTSSSEFNDNISNNETSESLSENSSIITELMLYTGNYQKDNIANKEAYDTLYSKNITYVQNISDVGKFTMAVKYWLFKNNKTYVEWGDIISDKEMESNINRIFGMNVYNSLNKKDLNTFDEPTDEGYILGCTSAHVVWYENKKQYEQSYECGGDTEEAFKTKFISAKRIISNNSTKIELTLAIYFIYEDQEDKIFSDIDFENNIGSKLDINKLSQYKHTFELDSNNNYIYKTVELVK